MICHRCYVGLHTQCIGSAINLCECSDVEHGVVPALARNTDPPTSHEAAASVDVTRRERAVEETLRALGRANTKEIARAMGVPRDSVSPRMGPLVKKGRVRATGLRRQGAIVYEVL
jgi:hypothetical protein